ncbi:hypothetical protein GJAV_G00262130 [Gymnothorax javanicus]|nr:hypothetical protein GJAV_G00262130 [Gymnothorax javanicus]
MKAPKATDVKRGIAVIRENLQCPICLDLLSKPVSTKCDHQFCRFCMMKLLDRRREISCPVCKAKVTKRSLQESPGFQRLVEGLQLLVQAYEEDTSTDYVTGESHGLEQPRCLKAGPRELQCNGGKACDSQGIDSADSSLTRDPKEARNSLSSAEAKQSYAELMDLGDSCAVTQDKEGFDSGPTDMPQALDMEVDAMCTQSTSTLEKPAVSAEVTTSFGAEITNKRRRSKRGKSDCASRGLNDGPEELPKKADGPPRRAASTAEGSDPERIVAKRCRRSLQKVSEWLLKISPMDVEEDCDDHLSDGGSSSSTVKENQGEGQPLTLRREDRKSLEDQVFGAVYRRDRKCTGNNFSRTLPSESGSDTAPPSPEEVIEIQEIASDMRTSSSLVFADADKMPRTEEKEAKTCTGNDSFSVQPIEGQTAELSAYEEVSQAEFGLNDLYIEKIVPAEPPNRENKVDDSPAFEVSLKRKTRRTRSDTGSAWKEVDDLRQDGNGELENVKQSKKRSAGRKKENRLTQARTAKVAKPLDPVCSGVGERYSGRHENGPLVVETEVQIESYPSSESQGNPAVRVTRQSKRLREVTDELQGIGKKTRLSRSVKDTEPHLDGLHAGEQAEFEMAVSAESSKRKTVENNAMRNGCVVDGELANIDKIDTSLCEDTEGQREQKESPTKKSISVAGAPNAESSSDTEHSVCKSLHPTSQASPRHSLEDAPVIICSGENFAPEAIQPNWDDGEKNDSEQDTEQLLKSFKATKRRSFQLDVPCPISSNRSSIGRGKQNEDRALEAVYEEINPGKDLQPTSQRGTVEQAEVQLNQDTLKLPSQSIAKQNEVEYSASFELISPTGLSDHGSHKSQPVKKSRILIISDSDELFEECSHSVTEKALDSKSADNSGDEVTPTDGKRKNSMLLCPALVSEEDPKVSAGDVNIVHFNRTINQNPLRSASEDSENSDIFKEGIAASSCTTDGSIEDSARLLRGFHSSHLAGKLPYSGADKVLESSMTPDDLLHSNVLVNAPTKCMDNTGPSNRADSPEVVTQCSSGGGPRLGKRKRAQRLESSGSEGSDEEDQLPSLAQLLGQDVSKQTEEKTVPPDGDLPAGHCQARTEDPVDSAPDALGDVAGNAGPASPSPDWVQASQGSVDLFDTPAECEGLPDERGHSESSQFSSEILGTQQKAAMQEELRRLEQMMALVSEALHKRTDCSQARQTGEPSAQHPSSAVPRGLDHHQNHLSSDQVGEGLARRKSSPPSALTPVSSPSTAVLKSGRRTVSPQSATGAGGPSPTQPSSTEEAVRVEAAGLGRNRRSRRLRSREMERGNAAIVDPAIQDDAAQTVTAAPSAVREERGLQTSARGVRPSVKATSLPHGRTTCSKMVLVASGLSGSELSMVKKFSKKIGGSLSAQVTPETTHVIIRTDENLVCERTLKYFLGIAARKWVVSFQWIVECFSHGKVLNEAAFEVRGDVVNGLRHQGPMRARTTGDQELLMRGFELYFLGAFTDMTTGQLQWMAELCGAKVVQDPAQFSNQQNWTQLVVVQPDSEEARTGCRAHQKRAVLVSWGWLLDSVATYTLQNTEEYRV